jgi:hypothetical protein
MHVQRADLCALRVVQTSQILPLRRAFVKPRQVFKKGAIGDATDPGKTSLLRELRSQPG